MFFQLLFLVTFVATCSYAGWCGGWPERAGAAIMAVAAILTIVAGTFKPNWSEPQTGIFIVDLLMLAALVNLALSSDRYWPLWVTSFHLIAVTIHVAIYVDRSVAAMAYANALDFWGYPEMAMVAAGTWNYQQRQRKASPPKGNAARY